MDHGRVSSKTLLLSLPLFRSFTQAELERFLVHSKKITIKSGQVLIHEGEKQNDFFIIESGAVDIIKQSKDTKEKHRIVECHRGDVIGELSLIDDQVRSASVEAIKKTELIQFHVEEIKKQLPELYTKIEYNLGRILSKRLRHTNEITVTALKENLHKERIRTDMAQFIVFLMTTMAIYTIATAQLLKLHEGLSITTPFTILAGSVHQTVSPVTHNPTFNRPSK